MSDDAPNRILEALDKLRLDMSESMERLESSLGKFGASQDEVRASQDEFRVKVMARMDRLQDALTSQRDADILDLGVPGLAEKIAREAREECRQLGEQVSVMIRQIRRLQSEVRELKGGL